MSGFATHARVVEFAKHRVDEETAIASLEMSSAERNSQVIGAAVALLLIATCVFSIFTIARPIAALTKAMLELAAGNFDVVLPGLGRKDEVVEVAGAVEKFKIVSEQKARDDAEAKMEQDRIAAQ